MSDIEKRWGASEEQRTAKEAYMQRVGLDLNAEPFYLSQEFRDARHRFRKTVNGSWGKEAC